MSGGIQAFPRAGYDGPDKGEPAVDGMELRDYFAAKAMQGCLSNSCNHTDGLGDPANFAKWAYQYADAMLKARES